MAKPEQTERATPKRRREARMRGQVPRSPDLSGSAVFIAIVLALHLSFPTTLQSAVTSFELAISHAGTYGDLTLFSVLPLFMQDATSYVMLIGTAFTAAVALGILANLMQFGFLFSPQILQPKFSKLNPTNGLKRLFFSVQTLVTLGKNLLKVGAVMVIVYSVIRGRAVEFYDFAHTSPGDIILLSEDVLYNIGLRFGIFLLALGLIDYFYERHRLEDSLKMTKTEVKDENRQQEQSPELRQAVKQRQRQMARRRMMQAVPKATVVVTNPTHFAVALEWDEITMDAPVLTAKGADLMARRIRELAREYDVPVVENPPLARTLYEKVELDSPVPPNLYAAVAQIIAFVYRLKNRTIA